MRGLGRLNQEQIVFALAVALCLVFALTLPGFLTVDFHPELTRESA